MTINERITVFAGLPVVAFDPHEDPPVDPSKVALRIDTDDDGAEDLFELRLNALVDADWAGQVSALVIGMWGEESDAPPPIPQLVAAASKLSGLRALFLGEMTSEENEISWINQSDVAPLLTAYPALEVLRIRGSQGLAVTPTRHEALRELAFESGGLPAEVIRSVGECELPALTHLELWLGTGWYGGDATAADLTVILAGARFPNLRHLGLRDAEIADEVAAAVAGSAVVAQLETLDLSLGVLSDVGAAALLAGQPLTHLRKLDLHHHFIGDELARRLEAELGAAGVEVDLSEGSDAEGDNRYIAVAE
jgi:hypothetical protein